MKKAVILMIGVLMLSLLGCRTDAAPLINQPENIADAYDMERVNMDEILFEEGIWANKDWGNYERTLQIACMDKETAIGISSALIKQYQRQDLFVNYSLQSVFYDTEGRIWIVTYAENKAFPGACVSFAIREENAEILLVWLGE